MKTATPRWSGQLAPRRLAAPVATPSAEEKSSLRQVLRSGNRSLNVWGLFSVLLYLLSVTLPLDGKVDMLFRATTLINGAVFTFACLSFLRTTIKVIVPVVLVLVLQGWSLVSYIAGFGSTARPDEWGRQLYFLLEVVSPYFVVMCLAKLNPNWPRHVLNLVVGLIALSAAVGVYEFLRLPGSSFILIAFWDKVTFFDKSDEVIRAIGLTRHPILFGFEMNVGLCLVTGLVYKNGAKPYLLAMAATMAIGLFVSQSRTSYVVAAMIVPVLIYIIGRQNRVAAAASILICAIAVLSVVTVFRGRLGYVFGQSNNLQTLQDRQLAWNIALHNIQPYMITGLGADATMLVRGRTGSRLNYTLSENAYLLFYGMYGLPGMILFASVLLTSIFGACSIVLRRVVNLETKSLALSVIMLVITLATSGYVANLSHHNIYLQITFLIAGVLAASAETNPQSWGPRQRPSLNARLQGMAQRFAPK